MGERRTTIYSTMYCEKQAGYHWLTVVVRRLGTLPGIERGYPLLKISSAGALRWWLRRTVFFEIYLIILVAGWVLNLLFTDSFSTSAIYATLRSFANQYVWAVALTLWLIFYAWSCCRKSERGRIAALSIIAGWWATVAVTIYISSPLSVSTGVVAYGDVAFMTGVCAYYLASREAR